MNNLQPSPPGSAYLNGYLDWPVHLVSSSDMSTGPFETSYTYSDDILVFNSRFLKKHREHIQKVLQRLNDAGLHLDIDKCEFEVQSSKYLGFIVETGKGIRMDPKKVKALVDCRSFLFMLCRFLTSVHT